MPLADRDITGIGIDFGTTNSVVALAYAGGGVESLTWPSHLTWPPDLTWPSHLTRSSDLGTASIFRTALTFWREGRAVRHVAGPEAVARAAAPFGEQRFVQSLKTHLASTAFSETRLYGQRFTIEDLVAAFLGHLLHGFEVPEACPVVCGRPVVFAGALANEDLACARLASAYAQAGVSGIELAYEPLGAAYWYARALKRDETVLVADFGGGTSDFSVLRFSREGDTLRADALSHSGVGVAGDTFDYRIIDHAVSPRLGKGATYRSFEKRLPVPAFYHASFSQWHQLSWLKSADTLNELRKLAALSDRPDELEALATIVEMDIGFALYRAIGEMKAELSRADRAMLAFSGEGVEIETEVTRASFESWIAPDLVLIEGAIEDALARAGLRADAVDAVFMTGGTSYVPAVRRLFETRFAPGRIHQGDAFQSVASGLALLAADKARGNRRGGA
jgi:hypothetical chaperone protein